MGGRRYDNEPKLNIKKVIGVIVGIAVIIMFIVTLTKLLKDSEKTPKTVKGAIHYFSLYTNNKWGVIDNNGDVVIEPTYDEMLLIPNSSSAIFLCTYDVDYENNTYKTKAINEKTQDILTGYDSIEVISNQNSKGQTWYENNVFKVNKDGKYGIIDGKGKKILETNYDEVKALYGVKDYILIEKDGNIGLYDIYGNAIINAEYKEIKALGDDNRKEFIVKNSEDKYGVVSSEKKLIIEPSYEEIAGIQAKDLYVVKENGKWSIINSDKSINITDKCDEVKEINDSNVIIKKDNKYGVINTEGEEKIKPEYDYLTYSFDNNYIAKKDNKYGIIDLEGQTKIEFKYENLYYKKAAQIFVADIAKGQSDIIDNNLEVKLTGILSEIDTEKGYMKVRAEGEYKYYNFKFEEKKNTEIFPKHTLFLDKKDGKYGYINKKGEVIVNYDYDDATEQNEYGFASVKKDGKWGSIDSNGKIVANLENELKNNLVINFIGKWHLGVDANANYYTDL